MPRKNERRKEVEGRKKIMVYEGEKEERRKSMEGERDKRKRN